MGWCILLMSAQYKPSTSFPWHVMSYVSCEKQSHSNEISSIGSSVKWSEISKKCWFYWGITSPFICPKIMYAKILAVLCKLHKSFLKYRYEFSLKLKILSDIYSYLKIGEWIERVKKNWNGSREHAWMEFSVQWFVGWHWFQFVLIQLLLELLLTFAKSIVSEFPFDLHLYYLRTIICGFGGVQYNYCDKVFLTLRGMWFFIIVEI